MTASAARRRSRRAVTAAAAGALALLLGEATGWPFLRVPVQSALADAAGVPLRLGGDFDLTLLRGPSLKVGQLEVGAAPGVAAPYLLRGESVAVQADWRDLWRWRFDGQPLRLRRLEADRLDAHLVRRADEAALPLPQVGTLVVRRGRIDVDDAPRDLRLQVRIDDRAAGEDDARVYELSATGLYGATALRLRVRAVEVLPLRQDADDDARSLVPVQIDAEAGDAHLQFDGSMAALLGGWRVDGDLRLRGPSLARVGAPLGLTLPPTAPFELGGQLSHGLGVWHLRADRLSVGRSRLSGDFRFDTRTQPWQLGGRLAGPVLALADLGPALGTTAAAEATDPGRLLPQRPFDRRSWQRMDAQVRLAIEEVDLGGGALVPLRDLQGELQLTEGVLRLQGLSGSFAGGRLGGSSTLDGRGDAAQWSADLQLRGVEASEWSRDAAPGPRNARGELAADLKLSGSGVSTAQILGSLQGSVDLRMQDGLLTHPGSERLGLRLAHALGVAESDARLRCARVELALQQGRVVPRTAVLGYAASRVHVDGHVDLRDESLALRLSVQGTPAATRTTPLSVDGTLARPVLDASAPPPAVVDTGLPGPDAGAAEPCSAPASSPARPRRY